MKHFASPSFWACYHKLPETIRDTADKNFVLLKNNSHHPALHFKKIGRYWSARIGLNYRALGTEVNGGVLWFWIGNHANYDKIIG